MSDSNFIIVDTSVLRHLWEAGGIEAVKLLALGNGNVVILPDFLAELERSSADAADQIGQLFNTGENADGNRFLRLDFNFEDVDPDMPLDQQDLPQASVG